jgi:hypothetical protein
MSSKRAQAAAYSSRVESSSESSQAGTLTAAAVLYGHE